jgi:hypothetical protein
MSTQSDKKPPLMYIYTDRWHTVCVYFDLHVEFKDSRADSDGGLHSDALQHAGCSNMEVFVAAV